METAVVQYQARPAGERTVRVDLAGLGDVGQSPLHPVLGVVVPGLMDGLRYEVDRGDLPAPAREVPRLRSGAAAEIDGDAGLPIVHALDEADYFGRKSAKSFERALPGRTAPIFRRWRCGEEGRAMMRMR